MVLCAVIVCLVAPVSVVTATRGLALSPPRSEYDIAPGTSKQAVINVSNYTAEPIDVQLDAEQFSVTDQRYDYAFDAAARVSKWVSFSSSELHLDKGKSASVAVTIAVPQSAEPGGYYISLFATTDVQGATGGIRTQQRVASLVYLTVKGNVTRVGNLKSLNSPLLFDGYQNWKVTIANTGTTHFRSAYSASIRNIFDDHEVTGASGSALVLPCTARAVTAQMPVPKYAGVYRVVYTIGLGDLPATTRTYYLIFLPKQMYVPLATLTVIVVGGMAYAAASLIRRRKQQTHD
ncbi:MAG TPA: hypothetical protein VMT96_01070 [Candidatus Bathyarchaeia archaeon]|nr:hypothetical protein [Candidatus Bathyarchaeia archaeon]